MGKATVHGYSRQAIVTRYIGPTDHRGARISARAYGGRVTVPYDYGSREPHDDAALALMAKMGWDETHDLVEGVAPDGWGNVYVLVPKGTIS
jgi:hypothetical protein